MTRIQVLEIFYRRRHELEMAGLTGPTKWFISRANWYHLPEAFQTDEFFSYVRITGGSNELCGLPVYQVIEDGIFECH